MRIQSINTKGAKELAAALNKLGVRIVKRSADLTVTLVNDYLDEQLTKLNRQHLSDHTPWLLVSLPAFSPGGTGVGPGKGACWTCLAERMKRNREVRALLDRKQARSSRFRRWRDTLDKVASSLRPSRSRKRSPPNSARR